MRHSLEIAFVGRGAEHIRSGHLRIRPHAFAEVPVILATGRADQAALDLVEADPRLSLLAKPFSKKELKAKLEFLGRA